jgi:hypothetical protein
MGNLAKVQRNIGLFPASYIFKYCIIAAIVVLIGMTLYNKYYLKSDKDLKTLFFDGLKKNTVIAGIACVVIIGYCNIHNHGIIKSFNSHQDSYEMINEALDAEHDSNVQISKQLEELRKLEKQLQEKNDATDESGVIPKTDEPQPTQETNESTQDDVTDTGDVVYYDEREYTTPTPVDMTVMRGYVEEWVYSHSFTFNGWHYVIPSIDDFGQDGTYAYFFMSLRPNPCTLSLERGKSLYCRVDGSGQLFIYETGGGGNQPTESEWSQYGQPANVWYADMEEWGLNMGPNDGQNNHI